MTMRRERRLQRWLVAVAVFGVSVGIAPVAGGATCQSWAPAMPHAGSGDNAIVDVAAVDRCNAWAVGSQDVGGTRQTLIMRWNGAKWSVVPSPNRGEGTNTLNGVVAISPREAWAVGTYRGDTDTRTLILRWNGKAWNVVKSPNAVPDSFNDLFAVAASSSDDVWAVGETDGPNGQYGGLLLHWNGRRWKVVDSPDRSNADTELFGVAVVSKREAWAVGASEGEPLILRWNGVQWRRWSAPSIGVSSGLWSVSATPRGDAWAVGQYFDGASEETLILRWNGTAWKRQPSPSPDMAVLKDVSVASATNGWAVGYTNGSSGTTTLILHWNGHRWVRQESPNPDLVFPYNNVLNGVAAVPRDGGAWAVGDYAGTVRSGFALHCC